MWQCEHIGAGACDKNISIYYSKPIYATVNQKLFFKIIFPAHNKGFGILKISERLLADNTIFLLCLSSFKGCLEKNKFTELYSVVQETKIHIFTVYTTTVHVIKLQVQVQTVFVSSWIVFRLSNTYKGYKKNFLKIIA